MTFDAPGAAASGWEAEGPTLWPALRAAVLEPIPVPSERPVPPLSALPAAAAQAAQDRYLVNLERPLARGESAAWEEGELALWRTLWTSAPLTGWGWVVEGDGSRRIVFPWPPERDQELVRLCRSTVERRAGRATLGVIGEAWQISVGPDLPAVALRRTGGYVWMAASARHLEAATAPRPSADVVRWARADLRALRGEAPRWEKAEGPAAPEQTRPLSDRILGLLGWNPRYHLPGRRAPAQRRRLVGDARLRHAMKAPLAAVAAASLLVAAAPRQGHLDTWRRDAAGAVSGAAGADVAAPVGSLQKPFVAKAWAAAHLHEPTPRWRCDGRSCWRPSGHGTLGLARATSVSCNAAFLALAAETPPGVLRSTLLAEGFVVDGTMTPEAAIGLGDSVTIAPRRLLEAYSRLTRTPWLAGDAVRREVLAGLRWAAEDGTARGVGRRGVWAKTGTVDAPARRGLETIGWAVAVDDAGSSSLARLSPGTGRQAAAALGPLLARRAATSATAPDGRVRVSLFEAMEPRSIRATNRGSAPVAGARGFVGAGAAVWLQPGDRLGESLWELSLSDPALLRTVKAALEVEARDGGGLGVVAAMEAREYVTGVLGAELARGTPSQRVALGAAALRLRAQGPRHAPADFCDTTHCAWFIGRGPRLRWPSPTRAIADDDAVRPVQDEEWTRMVEASRRPGPMYWTTHCGGRPLSAWAVWGSGERTAASCPLHAPGTSRPWTRSWGDDDVARAFGGRVTRLEVAPEDGVFRLLVETPGGTRRLLYDDAHRALAAVLGWDALPSPPDRVTRAAAGYRAEGVGGGHRVGLCLGGG